LLVESSPLFQAFAHSTESKALYEEYFPSAKMKVFKPCPIHIIISPNIPFCNYPGILPQRHQDTKTIELFFIIAFIFISSLGLCALVAE